MAGTVRPSLAGGGACTGGHQLAQLFLGPLPLLRKSSTSTPICRGKPRVSNLHFHQQESTKAVLWQPKPGFQLALLSLSQSSTLLLFLFGTPHHGPVQALFHCSNKCRLRELNGDLQTIASCSIGPGWTEREREALLKTGPRWTDARKVFSEFHGMFSATVWLRHVTGRSWAAYSVGNHGSGSRRAGRTRDVADCRLLHPWEGSAGGLVLAATIHVRGQGHLARARDADGQLHTHHPRCIFDCIQSKSML